MTAKQRRWLFWFTVRQFALWAWYRNGEYAQCVGVAAAEYMSTSELRGMADYYKGLAADRE